MGKHTSSLSWWVFVGLVAVELALSIVAALDGCGTCDRGALPNLGLLGAAGYAAILVLSLLGWRTTAAAGAFAAAGAHVALVATLVAGGRFCSLCFLAGALAIAMVVAALKADDANFARLARAAGAGAIAVQLILVFGWIFETRAITAAADRIAAESVPSRRVRIVAFERPDCPYCEDFERDVLPSVLRAFAGELDVERRDADASLPTPTIVVTGPGGREVFPGLPTVEMLADAVRSARGENHEKTLLSRPR